ncbi:MAG: histidine kinase dimerization/phosphoacceptor domain -containing protein [Bacteroidota bacterium]
MRRIAILFIGWCWTMILSAQVDPVVLDQVEYAPHPYFTHSSFQLHDELLVAEDQGFAIADVLSGELNFRKNDSQNKFDRTKSYWTKLELQVGPIGDTALIEFGWEQTSTWQYVDVYVVSDDSLTRQYQTGIGRPINEKSIRNALNLIEIPLEEGTHTIYARLEGHHLIHDDPRWADRFGQIKGDISIYLHDRETYSALEVYRHPGYFTGPRRGFLFSANYIKQCLEVAVDPTGTTIVDHMAAVWDEVADYRYNDYPDRDSVYWLRMKVAGHPDAPVDQVYGMNTGTHWNYDFIDVYTMKGGALIDHQRTGNRVRGDERAFDSKWNLFKVKVLPEDTVDVYLRLEGPGMKFIPEFNMTHIDQDTFWPRLYVVHLIYGAFLGILIVQILYFLIVGFIENEPLHFWFVALAAGFGLGITFVGGDVNFFLFPELEAWHGWLAGVGIFLAVLGLYRYIEIYLSLDELLPIAPKKIYVPLLVIHAGVCIWFGYGLESIGGNVALFEPYFQAFFLSIIVNFIIGLGLGIYALYRGNPYAKFYVGAFSAFIIICVIRLFYAFSSFDGGSDYQQDVIITGLYAHYFLFFGVILTIILLAFGNGYRINVLKAEQTAALVRIQEEERSNSLLVEKNQIIQERVDENELLLKEIHHRVKNNLQILASLLNLQSEYIRDSTALDAVQKGKSRVEAMGLIHQLLYTNDAHVTSIDMAEYLEELCAYLEDNFSSPQQEIHIHCEVEVEYLDIDTAIPIGLTITELITNAIKHGFVNGRSGVIAIHLWIDEQSRLCLSVADDGVGMTVKEGGQQTSFGSELVRLLSKKLKGTIHVESQEGYRTTIKYTRYQTNATPNYA